jgi:hypothetical protein
MPINNPPTNADYLNLIASAKDGTTLPPGWSQLAVPASGDTENGFQAAAYAWGAIRQRLKIGTTPTG